MSRQAAERRARGVGHMVGTTGRFVPAPQDPGRDHLKDLVVVPDLMAAFDRQIQLAQERGGMLAALSADNECEHGRLPHDPGPACGCWPEESAEESADSSVAEESAAPTSVRRMGRKLWCENGSHEWERPRQTGRLPRSCPEHRHGA